MKIKLLKFFIVAVFAAFAAGAFFISGNDKIDAQTRETAKKKAGILEKVAGYKTWKQIVKPASQTTPAADVVSVADSTTYG